MYSIYLLLLIVTSIVCSDITYHNCVCDEYSNKERSMIKFVFMEYIKFD